MVNMLHIQVEYGDLCLRSLVVVKTFERAIHLLKVLGCEHHKKLPLC